MGSMSNNDNSQNQLMQEEQAAQLAQLQAQQKAQLDQISQERLVALRQRQGSLFDNVGSNGGSSISLNKTLG